MGYFKQELVFSILRCVFHSNKNVKGGKPIALKHLKRMGLVHGSDLGKHIKLVMQEVFTFFLI